MNTTDLPGQALSRPTARKGTHMWDLVRFNRESGNVWAVNTATSETLALGMARDDLAAGETLTRSGLMRMSDWLLDYGAVRCCTVRMAA